MIRLQLSDCNATVAILRLENDVLRVEGYKLKQAVQAGSSPAKRFVIEHEGYGSRLL